MRNKILIVDKNSKEKAAFEEILQDIVEIGGELFFTDNREDGLAILKKERPQLVFLDLSLIGNQEDWVQEGVHVTVMMNKKDNSEISLDFILKPLKRAAVLEKCRSVLNLQEAATPIPPM